MFYKAIMFLTLTLLTAVLLSGCGAGDSNGSLSISVPASVTAGKSFQATATFTSPKGAQAMPISFSASDATLVSSSSADTNPSGLATVQLQAANVINGDRSVTITARAGSLTSSSTIIVRANKLTFTSPENATFTRVAGTQMEYFIAGGGTLIKYTDADGLPLAGKAISIKVNTLTGNVNNVIFHWNLADTPFTPGTAFILTTASDGTLPNSVVSVIATAPSVVATTNDYSVNFIISVTDSGFGEMNLFGDLPFSITASNT